MIPTRRTRSPPRDDVDVIITAARGSWAVTFDNLSEMRPWLSDAFCRLASGGGLGKRQLFTDGDEYVLRAQRPVILNGIVEVSRARTF